MPADKDPTQELQTQVLDSFRKSQKAVIDGMRTWAETIQQLVLPLHGSSGTARSEARPTSPGPTEYHLSLCLQAVEASNTSATATRLSCPRVVAMHQRFLCHSLAFPRTSSGVRPLVQRPV
jgi:hypothetical protein